VTEADRLRDQAAQAFRLAMAITDSPARQKLVERGRDLEAQAAAIERRGECQDENRDERQEKPD
jgi:hypothetical protein